MRTTITLAALILGTSACWNATENFRRNALPRAAFELDCPAAQLQITELSETTIGVSGCGKKAVYVSAPGARWLNNTGENKE